MNQQLTYPDSVREILSVLLLAWAWAYGTIFRAHLRRRAAASLAARMVRSPLWLAARRKAAIPALALPSRRAGVARNGVNRGTQPRTFERKPLTERVIPMARVAGCPWDAVPADWFDQLYDAGDTCSWPVLAA